MDMNIQNSNINQIKKSIRQLHVHILASIQQPKIHWIQQNRKLEMNTSLCPAANPQVPQFHKQFVHIQGKQCWWQDWTLPCSIHYREDAWPCPTPLYPGILLLIHVDDDPHNYCWHSSLQKPCEQCTELTSIKRLGAVKKSWGHSAMHTPASEYCG